MEARRVILNSARCKKCNTVLISHTRYDFKTCKCGNLSVDGGRDYIRILVKDRDGFEDLSVYARDTFEKIRLSLHRGSRGKNGDEPLKWVRLCDISDDYLQSLIEYELEQETPSKDLGHYIYEVRYRKHHLITIKE